MGAAKTTLQVQPQAAIKKPRHKPDFVMSSWFTHILPTSNLRQTVRRAKQYLGDMDFDAIAFRGMSGALIAPPLALRMNKTLIMVRKSSRGTHTRKKVTGDQAARRYLIVDDFVDTGKTCEAIVKSVKGFAPQAVCVGVLEVHELMKEEPWNNPDRQFRLHQPEIS